MLAGHFGIAQFGKGYRRELPFLLLVVAAYLPDIVRLLEELLTTQPARWPLRPPARQN